MKINFLVSNCYRFWIAKATKYLAADPYIVHVLEREGLQDQFKNIEIAKIKKNTRKEFQCSHNFVDQKLKKYTKIITERLDEIHETNHGEQFWSKCISLSLLRHVSLCHNKFQVLQNSFNPDLHDSHILDSNCYYTPLSFDDHRNFLQHTDFGQEQLFSVYCNFFYPGRLSTIEFIYDKRKVSKRNNGLISRIKRIKVVDIAERLFLKLLSITSSIKQPCVGIMGSYFSVNNLNNLIYKSKGSLQIIKPPELNMQESPLDLKARKVLTRVNSGFDSFDEFVFLSLLHLFPKSFIEDFPQYYNEYNLYFSKYTNLKWIVSENWIGNEASSMITAILKQKGVMHISNEHNYLSYQFLGNSIKYQISLVDEFVSLGWADKLYPSVIRGSSLFQWGAKKTIQKKEIDILFVLGLPIARAPEVNAAYGDDGAFNAQKYIETTAMFLQSLESDVLANLYVRGYPKHRLYDWSTYDQHNMLKIFFDNVKIYDDYTSSGAALMSKSKLVVVNYLSTAHLQAIVLDIPTVFIWDKETKMLRDGYAEFYDSLIDSGICQTSAEEAAKFICKIRKDPEEWWYSDKTRKSRNLFLEKNIGNPEWMVNYLLSKSNAYANEYN